MYISSSTFDHNNGSGATVADSTAVVTNSAFLNNRDDGVTSIRFGSFDAIGCIFYGNGGDGFANHDECCGVYALDALIVTDCVVSNNAGVGIRCDTSRSTTVTNTVLRGNAAGGLSQDPYSTTAVVVTSLSNCTIFHNGGVAINSALGVLSLTVLDSAITGNTAAIAASVDRFGSVVLQRNLLSRNDGPSSVVSLESYGSVDFLVIDGNVIQGNVAGFALQVTV